MITQVRDALKGVVAWIVVLLLIGAFAMWGVPEMRTFASNTAIKVGDQAYGPTYVSREFDTMYRRRAQESNGTFTRDVAIATGMPAQVVESIVNQAAIEQYAQKMNLAVPRAEVRDYLQSNEAFQNPATGKFDRLVLDAILQNNNMSVTTFEKLIKEDLVRTALIDSLAASGPLSPAFMDAMMKRETERRKISYLTVIDDMAGAAAEPTSEDLEAFYRENETVFTAPEYRTFDLLILRDADFRENLEAPEEEIRKLYDLGKERLYTTAETRTIYQITYEDEPDAQAAAASLRDGEPFEKIAEKRGLTLAGVTSTDITKAGILDPTVGDAAFAEGLKAGDVVDPVKSLFGWTVVQIVNVTPGSEKSYEEVRDQLVADYLDQDVRRKLQDALDEIEEVRDTGAELSEAAEAAGFETTTFGPVDRVSFEPGGAIIDKIPGEALKEAFALDEGEQSEALPLANNDGYFLVGLKEIRPPALKPYDDVRAEVEERWRAQERQQRISKTVADIRSAVEGGETFAAVAERYNRAPIELVIDRRFQNEFISSAFNEQIFSADLNSLVSSPAGASGAQVIAEIHDITYALTAIPPDQRERYRDMIGYQIDQELVEAFVYAIRDDLGVKIDNAKIDALFSDGL